MLKLFVLLCYYFCGSIQEEINETIQILRENPLRKPLLLRRRCIWIEWRSWSDILLHISTRNWRKLGMNQWRNQWSRNTSEAIAVFGRFLNAVTDIDIQILHICTFHHVCIYIYIYKFTYVNLQMHIHSLQKKFIFEFPR